MKIQIDLDDHTLDKIQKIADKDKRSRKQMIEIMLEKLVEHNKGSDFK